MTPRLKTRYREKTIPALMKAFKYKNTMQVPRIERVVLNMGLGRLTDAGRERKVIDEAVEEMAIIAGQRPVITAARKSIAGFKLREGVKIGCKVTLRGVMMYEFLNRLVNLALPRLRDFRGLSLEAFDGNGNYTLGLKEQIIFPEIEYSKVDKIKGMNITFVTTAKTGDEALELLKSLGFPFKKRQQN
ncbi:MAG: 50S ribosomal protein L5 [Candidatus Dadabacteria bacterium]|nr:50S ribosomal protein L5 [Candidatus Dadabacteria bacterium]